jgi:hypothetical protein
MERKMDGGLYEFRMSNLQSNEYKCFESLKGKTHEQITIALERMVRIGAVDGSMLRAARLQRIRDRDRYRDRFKDNRKSGSERSAFGR